MKRKRAQDESITLTLAQVRASYKHFFKREMPDDMTYYNALCEIVKKFGMDEVKQFNTPKEGI